MVDVATKHNDPQGKPVVFENAVRLVLRIVRVFKPHQLKCSIQIFKSIPVF